MASPQGEESLLFPENVAANARSLSYARGTIAAIAGACTGVLGLTNAAGFIAYLFSSILVGGLLYLTKAKRQPKTYFRGGAWDLFTSGLGGDLLGFTLWWSAFYAIVHLYQ